MRISFLIISLLLWLCKYQICDFVYPDSDKESIDNWNFLSTDILHLTVLTILLSINSDEKWFKIVLYIFIGFSSSDVIDRWVFGITNFVWSDIIMITIVLLIAYRKHIYNYVPR